MDITADLCQMHGKLLENTLRAAARNLPRANDHKIAQLLTKTLRLCRYLSRNTFIGTPHYIAPGETICLHWLRISPDHARPALCTGLLQSPTSLCACAEVMHVEVDG